MRAIDDNQLRAIDYSVRHSPRARHPRVNVTPEHGVEVVLPRRTAEREAAAVIEELRPWIERRLAELDQTRRQLAARAGTLPYLGATLRLVPERGRQRVHRRGDDLLVPAGDASVALERWYRRAARNELEPALRRAASELGHVPASVSIRNQQTRWGSCSPTGAISLNWRLLLAPRGVAEYVVWHEACHLEILDHSRRFWRLLARYCPDYREHQRWLRHSGATLVL